MYQFVLRICVFDLESSIVLGAGCRERQCQSNQAYKESHDAGKLCEIHEISDVTKTRSELKHTHTHTHTHIHKFKLSQIQVVANSWCAEKEFEKLV